MTSTAMTSLPDDVLPFAHYLAGRTELTPIVVRDAAVVTGELLPTHDAVEVADVVDFLASDRRPHGDDLLPVFVEPWAHDGRPNQAAAALSQAPPDPLLAIVVGAPPVEGQPTLAQRLEGVGRPAVFSGTLRTGESIAVLEDRSRPLSPEVEVPDDFRVMALMIARNEADILAASVADLVDQGVEAYVIENWSTDETFEIATSLIGRGVVGVERSPGGGPSEYYDRGALLEHVEAVADRAGAHWYISHDVDEVRRSPWCDVTLREAIFRVDRAGYDCIDFTVAEFHPTDDEFVPGNDHVRHFRHFEWGRNIAHFAQVRAWKHTDRPIGLSAGGGHRFDERGRKVYPYKFLLWHYPVRSQSHGERKFFDDRQQRLLPAAVKLGWHSHYRSIGRDHRFTRPTDELILVDDDFAERFVVERLSGIGILAAAPPGPMDTPSWASVLRGSPEHGHSP